jgi:RNA polymerase sigma-70 factor (ECF subfamily)
LREITVTFDRDMRGGFSWTGGGPNKPRIPEGQGPRWRDKRTCVYPVALEPGHYYRVGINSKSFKNFKSAEGVPVRTSAIYFTTAGASDAEKAKVTKPKIVSMDPANGAKDVDPNLKELRVTFDRPMGGGFSWTGGGPHFPKFRDRPRWIDDGKTCIVPVELKPNWDYRLGLNSPSHKNFTSRAGVALDPVVYRFKTRSE